MATAPTQTQALPIPQHMIDSVITARPGDRTIGDDLRDAARRIDADRFRNALRCLRDAKIREVRTWDDTNRAARDDKRNSTEATRRVRTEAALAASRAWLERKRWLGRVMETLRQTGGAIVLDGWRYEVTPNGNDFFESEVI